MSLLKEQTGEGLISLLAIDLKSRLAVSKKSSICALVSSEKSRVFIVGMPSLNPKLLNRALIPSYNGSSQNPVIIPDRPGMCQPDLNLAAHQNGKSSLYSAIGFKVQIKSSPFPFHSVTAPQNSCPEDNKILAIAKILFGELGFCYS